MNYREFYSVFFPSKEYSVKMEKKVIGSVDTGYALLLKDDTIFTLAGKLWRVSSIDHKHFIHPSTPMKTFAENGPTLIFTKGEGIHLTDTNGRKYIDGLSSLWNVNVGHGRSEIGEVAMKQMGTLAFSSTFNSWSHEPAIRLAAEIAKWTPGDLNATFFTSGAMIFAYLIAMVIIPKRLDVR